MVDLNKVDRCLARYSTRAEALRAGIWPFWAIPSYGRFHKGIRLTRQKVSPHPTVRTMSASNSQHEGWIMYVNADKSYPPTYCDVCVDTIQLEQAGGHHELETWTKITISLKKWLELFP